MKRLVFLMVVGLLTVVSGFHAAQAETAGKPGRGDLVIASGGHSETQIIVSPVAGGWEKRAAEDLAHYIELMSGAKVPVVDTEDGIAAAMRANTPLLIVGQEAIKAKPDLQRQLQMVAKKNPILRTDVIVLKREGNRVYLAGNNDPSHYYAVAELL